MILAFLLVVIVDKEIVSDDDMLFRDVYRCNFFAWAIESGRHTDKRFYNWRRQENVTAYCIPKRVRDNVKFYD